MGTPIIAGDERTGSRLTPFERMRAKEALLHPHGTRVLPTSERELLPLKVIAQYGSTDACITNTELHS
jgi:hypothetical protein